MEKIVISSCLLGCNCRYDGKTCHNDEVIKLAEDFALIPICPEQMGGLTTPRAPSEITGDKVVSKEGKDVTKEYTAGAAMALRLAQLNGVKYAILKAKSPACGTGLIYDGTFSGNKINGNGIASTLLQKNGIRVFTEDQLAEFRKAVEEDK